MSRGQKFNKTFVTKNLQLLADFRPDVVIVLMQGLQIALEPVHFIKAELICGNPVDAVENVKHPAAGGNVVRCQLGGMKIIGKNVLSAPRQPV